MAGHLVHGSEAGESRWKLQMRCPPWGKERVRLPLWDRRDNGDEVVIVAAGIECSSEVCSWRASLLIVHSKRQPQIETGERQVLLLYYWIIGDWLSLARQMLQADQPASGHSERAADRFGEQLRGESSDTSLQREELETREKQASRFPHLALSSSS